MLEAPSSRLYSGRSKGSSCWSASESVLSRLTSKVPLTTTIHSWTPSRSRPQLPFAAKGVRFLMDHISSPSADSSSVDLHRTPFDSVHPRRPARQISPLEKHFARLSERQ